MQKNPIIIALDGKTSNNALKIAAALKNKVWGFKITDLLFEDPMIITELKKFGKVFADAKLHDIPTTVRRSVTKLSAIGADLITVHACGGREMMKAAKDAAGNSKIIAVTILTSLDEVATQSIFSKSIKESVVRLAYEIQGTNVDGIICSAHELKNLIEDSELKHLELLKVVPGVRPSWYSESDDQKRTVTPAEAIRLGADLLVIGRPIMNSDNPIEAVDKILIEIKGWL